MVLLLLKALLNASHWVLIKNLDLPQISLDELQASQNILRCSIHKGVAI